MPRIAEKLRGFGLNIIKKQKTDFMVNIDGIMLNITPELQAVLKANPKKEVSKPVLVKTKNPKSAQTEWYHKEDNNGEKLYTEAVVDTHPNVYFDIFGRYYFNVFKTVIIEHEGTKIEVITTNPKIKTDKDCNMYGRGIKSHSQIIAGSELWDTDSQFPYAEVVCKGDPETKIVKVMTSEDVLAVDLKPTGDNIAAKIANSSDAEKAMMLEQLLGKESAAKIKNMIEE